MSRNPISLNYLFAVNPDGTEKWRFPIKWGNDFWSSPTIGKDGTIYIGSARAEDDPKYKGGVFAINPDGTEKWFFEDSSGITSTAALGSEGTIYIGGNDLRPEGGNVGNVLALDPKGRLLWKFKIEDWMEYAANDASSLETIRKAHERILNGESKAGTASLEKEANNNPEQSPEKALEASKAELNAIAYELLKELPKNRIELRQKIQSAQEEMQSVNPKDVTASAEQ